MKENKGEQPEQERAKDILLKYLGYGHEEIEVSFHPTDIRLMVEAMKDYAGECVMTYHAETMQPAQPSKVQEDLKKENALLEAREVAWQNKHSFLMEEIGELKAWKEDVVKFAELCMVFGLTFDGLRQQWKDGTGQIISRQIVYDFIKSKLNNL